MISKVSSLGSVQRKRDVVRLPKPSFTNLLNDGGTNTKKIWAPGENYRPASRAKRLLQDYNRVDIPASTVTVTCKECKSPMKLRFLPRKAKTECAKMEGTCEELSKSRIEMQRCFDKWWATTMTSTPASRTVFNSVECRRGHSKKKKPHHYYHHHLVKQCEETKYEKKLFSHCADCPEQLRSWIRKKSADHYYNPQLFSVMGSQIRATSTIKYTEEEIKRVSNTLRLREKLETIMGDIKESVQCLQ